MPEGDTLHKLARALRPRLEGRALERLWLRDRGEVRALAGRRVAEVAALGKHLLVALAPDGDKADWVLHVHLGMHGRFLRGGRDGPGRRPPAGAWLALRAGGSEVVCTRPSLAELLRRRELGSHPRLARLGPDLLAPPIPFARIVARARAREPRSAVELLLDQRVACGAGNAIANEALFWEGVHPFTRVDALDDADLERLFRRAALLLAWNVAPGVGRRTTTREVTPTRRLRPGEPRLFVHERAGLPCLRCSARVQVARVGDASRPAWWCPRCQTGGRSRAASSRRA